MANVLPEVRPEVRSMPFEGFVMQTDGSARRSFIKNVNDEYYVRGVPGHTHNASAMISVEADYSEKRGAPTTIDSVWAPADINLAAEDFIDSVEPDNLDERTDRAIERGIGNIVLIPENCQHIIDEPAQSVSELRTICCPRDRLQTLTYVDNLYGWVNPSTGNLGVFNQTEPVMINFYGYQQPSVLVDLDATSAQYRKPLLSMSPVTIGSPYEYVRYIVSHRGSSDKYRKDLWDGFVPFYWDAAKRIYKSRPFSKYFEVVRIVSEQAPIVNNATNNNQIRNNAATKKTWPGGAGTWDGAAWSGVTAMALAGTIIAPALAPEIVTADYTPIISPDQFKVDFPAYETYPASDGYCMFVGVGQEDSHFNINHANHESKAHTIVPDMPIDVIYAGNELLSDPFWFGPPAYRIPVGGTHAIPAPPRHFEIEAGFNSSIAWHAADNNYTNQEHRGTVGYTDDRQESYFTEIDKLESLDKITHEYSKSVHHIMKLIYFTTPQVPGVNAPQGSIVVGHATAGLLFGAWDSYHLGKYGHGLHPTRPNIGIYYSNFMPNFGFAPFAAYVKMDQPLTQPARLAPPNFFESRNLRQMYEPMATTHVGFNSPLEGTVLKPTENNPNNSHLTHMTTGQVHRAIKEVPYHVVVGANISVTLHPDAYNHFMACPMASYLYTNWWRHKNFVTVAGAGGYPDALNAVAAGQRIPVQISDAHSASISDLFTYTFTANTRAKLTIQLPLNHFFTNDQGAIVTNVIDSTIPGNATNINDATAFDDYRFHCKNWIRRAPRTFHSSEEVEQNEDWEEKENHPANENTPHTHGGYRLYTRFAKLRFAVDYDEYIEHNVAPHNGQIFPLIKMIGATGGFIPWHLFQLRVGTLNVPLGAGAYDHTPVVESVPVNPQGQFTVRVHANGTQFISVLDIVPDKTCSLKVLQTMVEYIEHQQYLGTYGYTGGEFITVFGGNDTFAVPNLLELFKYHLNALGEPSYSRATAHRDTAAFTMLMDHTKYSGGTSEYFEFETPIETLNKTHSDVEFGANPAVPAQNTTFMRNLDKEYTRTEFTEEQFFHPDAGFGAIGGHTTAGTSGYSTTGYDQMGNYFVMDDKLHITNTHVEFHNFYCEFEPTRPMFFMLNNYGRCAPHAGGDYGLPALNGSLHVEPEAFHFKAGDLEYYQRDEQHMKICMRILKENLHSVPHAGGNAVDWTDVKIGLVGGTIAGVAPFAVTFGADNHANASANRCPIGERDTRIPKTCLFVPGKAYVEQYLSNNWASAKEQGASRGLVKRDKLRISQHLCAPILNPDTRIECTAPLNYGSGHLPPEMRDFRLLMRNVDFSFLGAADARLQDIVLSEFDGGIQTSATQDSLLYLPHFQSYNGDVDANLEFSLDCYSNDGMPSFVCIFCRNSINILQQPLITKLSIQNRTTMKKSNTFYNTNVHEMYHTTQRNTNPRANYDRVAYNRRQTILLSAEDIGVLGMDTIAHYQRQKRVVYRFSGNSNLPGKITVMFVYNNRGLHIQGVQQSVVHL